MNITCANVHKSLEWCRVNFSHHLLFIVVLIYKCSGVVSWFHTQLLLTPFSKYSDFFLFNKMHWTSKIYVEMEKYLEEWKEINARLNIKCSNQTTLTVLKK